MENINIIININTNINNINNIRKYIKTAKYSNQEYLWMKNKTMNMAKLPYGKNYNV